jgi:signal transduction histidine kinase
MTAVAHSATIAHTVDVAEQLQTMLNRWPRGFIADARSLVQHASVAGAEVFGCRRVIFVWEDEEDPALIIASTTADGNDVDWQEESPDRYPSLVEPALHDLAFFAGPHASRGIVETIDPAFSAAHGIASAYSAPLKGDCIEGRIFLVDPAVGGESSIPVVEAMARLVESALDAIARVRTERGAAVTMERFRVARDLHDGLLQSFTGVVLQLETVHDILEREAERARRLLTEIQGAIMEDQRELRVYVEQLRPRRRKAQDSFDFAARTKDLCIRFERQWGVRVTIDVEEVEPQVWRALGQETFRLIQEAVANAAKHGTATEVGVVIRTDEGALRIRVVDNGSGFVAEGSLCLETIRQSGVGPSILAERVAALNGDLVVDSGQDGVTVAISIPLGWVGA